MKYLEYIESLKDKKIGVIGGSADRQAFVTMLLVRHGDAKVLPKKGLEAIGAED
jgi:hypothetical protein